MRAVDIHRVAAAARVASGGLVVSRRSADLHTRYLNLTLHINFFRRSSVDTLVYRLRCRKKFPPNKPKFSIILQIFDCDYITVKWIEVYLPKFSFV